MRSLSSLHQKFGLKIKKLRKEHNLTQEDLAEAIKCDRSYVGFFERGERNVTLSTIAKIAKAMKVEIKDLFEF